MLLRLPDGLWMARCPIIYCSWFFVMRERRRCRTEFHNHWADYHDGELSGARS